MSGFRTLGEGKMAPKDSNDAVDNYLGINVGWFSDELLDRMLMVDGRWSKMVEAEVARRAAL